MRIEKRNLGIDALRAVSMFFVICQHILGQGGIVVNAGIGSGKYYFLSLLQILATCAVDVYGITTGYLMCEKRFRLARIGRLWVTTVFWSVALSCCFFVFVPESRTISELVSMFLPILRGRYWFFTAYFVVMVVSPVLNVVIRTLSRRQFKLLLAAIFVIFGVVSFCSLGYDVMRISGGNHFAWMIALYLIGGYLKKYCRLPVDDPSGTRKWLLGYFLFALVHLAYKVAVGLVGLQSFSDLLLTCVSPLILGEAVCLFQYFRQAGEKYSGDGFAGKLIRFITPGVYSVYIIHVHPKVFWSQDIINLFRPWDDWNGLQVCVAMIVTALAVFTVCVLLDWIRQQLFRCLGFDRTVDRVSDWTERKIRAFLAE